MVFILIKQGLDFRQTLKKVNSLIAIGKCRNSQKRESDQPGNHTGDSEPD